MPSIWHWFYYGTSHLCGYMWEILHKSPKRIKRHNNAGYQPTLKKYSRNIKHPTWFPYLAAVYFLNQKESAHICALHSSRFLYQRRWPFWSKCRNIIFLPVHGCCGWECKWYWGGILLTPLWTRSQSGLDTPFYTRIQNLDTPCRFLHSWSGESTGKSLTHPGGLICFVSHGQSSDLCCCVRWKKKKSIILETFTRTNPGMPVHYRSQSKLFPP